MARRRKLWIGLGCVALIATAIGAGVAVLNRDRPGDNVTADGLALAGYDPVTYFPEGGGHPRRGNPRWTAERRGRRYQFVSAANRERFVAAPERFEPEFGGWCAYAVAHGYKFEVDPESFLVEDDRLLLFYRGLLGDARGEFQKEGVSAGLRRADSNWPTLSAE